jgi:hypothetical protein
MLHQQSWAESRIRQLSPTFQSHPFHNFSPLFFFLRSDARRQVRETSQQVTGWKSSKQVTFAKTPSPFDLISDEASQPKSPCLSFETRLPGSAESTGSRASSKGWPKGEEDCARPPADVVLRIASSMFQCMDGLRSQLSRELRQVGARRDCSLRMLLPRCTQNPAFQPLPRSKHARVA